MQNHASGCSKGTRQGSEVVIHTFLFCSTGVTGGNVIASGTNQKLMTIPGSVQKPAIFTIRVIDIVANTASGAVTASVGSASAGTQFINGVSLKATAGTNYITANVRTYSEVDVQVWLNYTVASGTDAAGKFAIEVEAFEVNVTTPNNQEA